MQIEERTKPSNATWVDSATIVADVDHPLGRIVINLYDDGSAKVSFKKSGPGAITKAYLEGHREDIVLAVAPSAE